MKSCYDLILGEDQNNEAMWRLIWQSKLHERLELFLWRVVANFLPMNSILAARMGGSENRCGLCGQEAKTFSHLFRTCNVSRAFAFACK